MRGVLNDSTNISPKKQKTRLRAVSQSPEKDRPSTSSFVFNPPVTTPQIEKLPMPKALTASLPGFDSMSEKPELSRNNIKKYPHLTDLQNVNYFHSLLRGKALQAYCNLEDEMKDSLEEEITAFRRRVGKSQSSGTTTCEWDNLHFYPAKQRIHEFFDSLQKTVNEAFKPEAQQFIDKVIYVKMPNHVEKKLNRVYLDICVR